MCMCASLGMPLSWVNASRCRFQRVLRQAVPKANVLNRTNFKVRAGLGVQALRRPSVHEGGGQAMHAQHTGARHRLRVRGSACSLVQSRGFLP